MGYAKVRNGNWHEIELRDLEGNRLKDWTPNSLWVKSICFDSMQTALYVLTEDDDFYFTAHSIDLEFTEDVERVRIETDSTSMVVELIRFNLEGLNFENPTTKSYIEAFAKYPSAENLEKVKEVVTGYQSLLNRLKIQIEDFEGGRR